MTSQGYGATDKLTRAGDVATGTIVFNGTPPIQIPAGAATGDVATSDANGNVSWQVPAAAVAITTETARAVAAETANAAAITANTTAVTAETTRATAAENVNTAAITANTTAVALKAPLASPALTGTPTAPTQTTGDSSTKLATDAFVATAVATETTRATTAEAAAITTAEAAAATAATAAYAPKAGVAGAFSVGGVLAQNAGASTAGSAPVLTPTFASGTAAQLSDTTRDYMLLLQIGTAGTAFSVAIGPTSTPANTIYVSATPPAGALLTIRIPAGFYLKWSGTGTTLASQKAIGC